MKRNWKNVDNYMKGKIYPVNANVKYGRKSVRYNTEHYKVCIDYSCLDIDNIIMYIAYNNGKVFERRFYTASGAYLLTINEEGNRIYERPTKYY